MQLSIKVDGKLVRQGLEDLGAEIPQIGRRRIRTFIDRVYRRVSPYPPERPGQRYRRTGNLFSHWQIVALPDGYQIANTAMRKGKAYPQYVIGDARGGSQAWMHKGRWEVLRDVVEDEAQSLPDEIKDDIIMVARSKGL